LPGEDAVGFERLRSPADGDGIRIAVPGLPYIANFDDLDPLAAEPDVDLRIVRPGSPLPADTDLVILPGSKATLADLAFLREQEWDVDLRAHVRQGGHVLGLCAGLQMLGRGIADPGGIEGLSDSQPGLGLLELETELTADKRLANVEGIELHSGAAVRGYEMHVGRSRGTALARPMLQLAGRPDGAVSPDGRVMGCYLHGLFSADGFRHAFLQRFRADRIAATRHAAAVETVLDDWATHLARHLPADELLKIAGHAPSPRRGARHAAAALFDSYLIVDWSAASGRNTGKDSIWFCLLQRHADRLEVTALENPPLRALALVRLRALLADLAGAGYRVLAGFDFPNGYPRGFAARAGFAASDDAGPPWRAVWDGLAALIEDGPDNKNNRFHAAAALNRRISGGAVPFWGHPHQHRYDDLQPRPVAPAESVGLPTRRLCEAHVPKAKTCWQLAYNGGVGSQTLLGIPVQRALRDDPALAETTRVWPFETGLTVPHPCVRVLLAEVYPSLFGVGPRQARDRWQVENTARRLAERDAQGLLALDLAGPEDLGPAERRLVEAEEGWILGAGTCNAPGP